MDIFTPTSRADGNDFSLFAPLVSMKGQAMTKRGLMMPMMLQCMRYVLFPELSTYPVVGLSVSAIQRGGARTHHAADAAPINGQARWAGWTPFTLTKE